MVSSSGQQKFLGVEMDSLSDSNKKTDRINGSGSSPETDLTNGSGSSPETDQTNGSGSSPETDRTNGSGSSPETDRTNGTDSVPEIGLNNGAQRTMSKCAKIMSTINYFSAQVANLILSLLTFILNISFTDSDNNYDFTSIEQQAYIAKNNIFEIYNKSVGFALSNLNESILLNKYKKFYKDKGIRLRTNRKSPINFITIYGQITFSRYILRPETEQDYLKLKNNDNKTSIIPLDDWLKISNLPFKISPLAMLEISKWAAEQLSFKSAAETIQKAMKINITYETVRSVVDVVGGLIFENECRKTIELFKSYNNCNIKFPTKKINEILYIEIDGSMVHILDNEKSMDDLLKERNLNDLFKILYTKKIDNKIHKNNKKNKDTTKKTKDVNNTQTALSNNINKDIKNKINNDNNIEQENKVNGWSENKLAIFFSSDNMQIINNQNTKDDDNNDCYKILKRDYLSYLGSVEIFKLLLFNYAIKNGYGEYNTVVIISDGATWIRNVKEEFFDDAIQILDFWHLSKHIYDFAKLYFNEDKSKYIAWAEKAKKAFKESKSKDVLPEITKMQNIILKKGIKFNFKNYINNNINNIDYKKFKAMGLYIGSGHIESGNKTVVQERLKRSGMRWSRQCAQHLLTLRAKLKSNLWYEVEDYILKYYKK
jgi:hypothetical protein